MFEWVANPEAWIALVTLAALEIVLGIDNIIFISILVGRLPEKQREPARYIGLTLAMVTRLLLLFSIVWVMGLVEPWFTVLGQEISGRDLILIGGGLFLLAKATHEIHNSLEGVDGGGGEVATAGFGMVLVQIAILDIVFSLDSVITAVGLVDEISIMAVAIVLAVIVMLVAAKSIGDFVDRHPTVKMLALSFLIMVGLTLIVEGFDVHVPKGYIYFAMAFSVAVEMLNLRLRKRQQARPVALHSPYREESAKIAEGNSD
ncbi:TerC family protein [Microbulbifer thermotolerans]|uniref:TerC family protein n=1 Tax=Microbulbifer thermotolerans TaxID=252514 RepID=UPI00224B81A1|nr:TerC family protein [Microbulbifer thermotolerans]MCX2781022.1 TerC family protein [Microbulbifer thermotolerans]MCX2804583.1 TerC family protein [Microbulbifer thermotolerans]MCX2841405.1 TerC family protein [Microbulbifer thermotolerans]